MNGEADNSHFVSMHVHNIYNIYALGVQRVKEIKVIIQLNKDPLKLGSSLNVVTIVTHCSGEPSWNAVHALHPTILLILYIIYTHLSI